MTRARIVQRLKRSEWIMPVHNADIAAVFDEIADLLEIESANPFRVRAYRNAARTLRDLNQDVAAMIAQGEDVTELPGIGKDLASKIKEIVETGTAAMLEEHRKEVLVHGITKASVRLACGLQVDLRVVPEASYGAALQYFTGSKEHNVLLRQLAQQQGAQAE